ncbi:MAG: hypothetical protein EOO40_09295 [Deltaproteobacteria bacterium]|nr:MAG: hypothetical protein EOO40_09295 [Deltaproteobacteria bacterium]
MARQVLEPYDAVRAVGLEELVLQTVLALPDVDHGAWARITSDFIAMVGTPAASLGGYRDALEKKAALPPDMPPRSATSPVVVEQVTSFPAVITQIGDGALMQTLYGLLRILPQYDEIISAPTSEREAAKDVLAIVMGNQELRRNYFYHLELGAPDGQPLIMSADMLLLVHEATRLHGPLLPAELAVLLLCYMTARHNTKAPERWDALLDACMDAAEEDLWGLETDKLDTLQPHLRPLLQARSPRIRWAHTFNQRLTNLRTRFANGPQAYQAMTARITGAVP